MKRLVLLSLLLIFTCSFLFSQEATDSLFYFERPKTNFFNTTYSKFIIPSGLITYGILTRAVKPLQDFDLNISNKVVQSKIKRCSIDDYILFAPPIIMYGLDLTPLKTKHNFKEQTLVLATSYAIMTAIVQTSKYTTNVQRPDASNAQSFPSGHTATAFVGAHILFKEYKDLSPWIGVFGYAIASTTGIYRIINNKHWFSDVVTGAGIGILSAELGYLLLPCERRLFGMKEKGNELVIAPIISTKNYGFLLSYTF